MIENTLQYPECETTMYKPHGISIHVGNVEIEGTNHAQWSLKIDGKPVKAKRFTLRAGIGEATEIDITMLPGYKQQ